MEVLRRLSLTLVCVAVATQINFGAEKNGEKSSHVIKTPSTPFYGYMTCVVETDKKWVCDLGNGYKLEIIPRDTRISSDFWEPSAIYRIIQNSESDKTSYVITEKILTESSGKTAIKINNLPQGTIITVPGGHVLSAANATFSTSPLCAGSEITVSTGKKSKILKLDTKFEPYPQRENVNLETFEFSCPTSEADDDHTGIWTYLDRITPKNHKVIVGGRYEIAIVPDPENFGALMLVYIGGAIGDDLLWNHGDVRGRLIPTSFPGHYNLIWFDTHGFPAGMGETSATFEGINLLTLDFPLLESQIRFERQLVPDNE